MHWLLIGYMFLFIDRPFEVWPILGDIHIERIYMLVTLSIWLFSPKKRIVPNIQHLAYAAFAVAVLACWLMSPWMDRSQPIVEDWFKIVVFYVLLVTTVHDEQGLKRIVVGFVTVMGLYLLHSFREYLGGKYTYRMGISRMVGVDTTLGDPNSFGASIVFVLPFVAAFWRNGFCGRFGQLVLIGYTGLSTLCILLTGSRSSLLGLVVWFGILILGHRRRFLWLTMFAAMAPVAFVALPQELQLRFETIIWPEVGPKNAQESGEGRIQGFLIGLELWATNPLNGVGPGAWRPATGQPIESHNLIGQLLGELGSLGAVSFLMILGAFGWNLYRVRKFRQRFPEWSNDFVIQFPSAIAVGLFLLLFMGLFGHNLFRFSWLWYGGFLIISLHCLNLREEAALEAETEAIYEAEEENHEEAEPIIPASGWVYHPAHG